MAFCRVPASCGIPATKGDMLVLVHFFGSGAASGRGVAATECCTSSLRFRLDIACLPGEQRKNALISVCGCAVRLAKFVLEGENVGSPEQILQRSAAKPEHAACDEQAARRGRAGSLDAIDGQELRKLVAVRAGKFRDRHQMIVRRDEADVRDGLPSARICARSPSVRRAGHQATSGAICRRRYGEGISRVDLQADVGCQQSIVESNQEGANVSAAVLDPVEFDGALPWLENAERLADRELVTTSWYGRVNASSRAAISRQTSG